MTMQAKMWANEKRCLCCGLIEQLIDVKCERKIWNPEVLRKSSHYIPLNTANDV